MADVYEQNLASKSTLTTTDYIRVVGSDNVSYKQLVSDVAKKIIENYTGSTLAGSAQSVKSAVDSLNSKTAHDVRHTNIVINNGYCQISYPTGYTNSDVVIIQPDYDNASLMGWTPVIQKAANTLIIYVRQGTVTPADGSKVTFRAVFFKA